MADSAPQLQGCIFNLDGVIVDTARHHYTAWRRLANGLGFDISAEQHEGLRGLSRMSSLERILEWGGVYMSEAEKLHWADVKKNWYTELIADMMPGEVLPGVLLFLRQLKADGVRIALSSASLSARTVLRSLQIESFFDAVIDGHNTKKNKPDPECFLLAALALKLDPEQCLVFEDAPLGVQAARGAGFKVVGIGPAGSLFQPHLVIHGFEGVTFSSIIKDFACLQPEVLSV